VPGDPLLAFERRKGTVVRELILHRAGNEHCAASQKPGRPLTVSWAAPDPQERKLLVFQILAEDRRGLLEDILAQFRDAELYLYKVDAEARIDGSADITLVAEAPRMAALATLQERLATVDSVHQVLSAPTSPAQRLALSLPAPRHQPNPYTEQEVYDRTMFYDREAPVDAICEWLMAPPPTEPLMLHGQRRVGKSSLARYLVREILPQRRLAQPVFVDLQGLSGTSAQNISNYLVNAVYRVLNQPAPVQEPAEEPIPWLSRALRTATKLLRGYRLLLIIDEFNVLLDREAAGLLDSQVFANLRALMTTRRDLNWLLIVQDTHFRDPARWGSAAALFQQARPVSLAHLDSHWARKLIQDPAARCGVEYRGAGGENLFDHIWELTAGNPYLIQVVCRQLLERVRRQDRANISEEDLRQVEDLVIHDGQRYLAHFLDGLIGVRKILVAAIAAGAAGHEWVAITAILDTLRGRGLDLSLQAAQPDLYVLERQGMLALRPGAGEILASIPIGLFHRWVKDHIDPEAALLEWQTARPRQ
jgi:hypothetical protein